MNRKIPKHAKRVYKGIIFDVYQWQQKMFDGKYQTFEALKRPNTVEVLAEQNGKIILGRQKQPNKNWFYSLFGGRQDRDETPLQTAKRELKEEAGFVSKDWELLNIYEPHFKIDWKIYFYVARNCQKSGKQKLDTGEQIIIKKVSFNQFMEIIDNENFWGDQIANDIFRIKQNKKKLAEFKKRIFEKI